jgi:hypothetical protein
MTDEHAQLIAALEDKIQRIISLYESEKKEKQALIEEYERKKAELMHAHKSILELQDKYEHLKMARVLSLSKEEQKASRNRLSKLVREIDKCIALVNQ